MADNTVGDCSGGSCSRNVVVNSCLSYKSLRNVSLHKIEAEELFDQQLATIEANKHADAVLLVYVISDIDPATGRLWCPDCIVSEPLLAEVFNSQPQRSFVLVECPLQRAKFKGNAQHPYRLHPKLQVQRIPTLYLWHKGSPTRQLIETELFDKQRLANFIID